jgi:hypothetical protein
MSKNAMRVFTLLLMLRWNWLIKHVAEGKIRCDGKKRKKK